MNAKIQKGLSNARWLAVILTPDSIKSPWVQRELSSGLIRELEERQVVVLPLLFRDCQLPPFLKDKLYADFRTSYKEGLNTLLNRLSPPIKPDIVFRLMSEDKSQIKSAYSKIPKHDRHRYINYLTRCLNCANVSERKAAIYALWALDSDRVIPTLLAGVADVSQSVRRLAVFLMGETRNPIFKNVIAGLMSDGNPQIRQAARDAFKKLSSLPKSRG